MNYEEYSDWLINFSNAYNISEEKKLPVYLAGIIEEIGEYESLQFIVWEDTTLRKKKELGDVLAYLTLARQSNCPEQGRAKHIVHIESLMQIIGGYLKRLYRGDVLPIDKLHELAYYTWCYLLDEINRLEFTLDEIIQLNYDKLTNRKQLLGTGDDR